MTGSEMGTWRAALAEWYRDRDPRALAAAIIDLPEEEAEQVLAEIENPDFRQAVRDEVAGDVMEGARQAVAIWKVTGDTLALADALAGVSPGGKNDALWAVLTREERIALIGEVVRLLGPGYVSLWLSPGGPAAVEGIDGIQ